MDELTTERTFNRGSSGRRVRIIQEWLCLHGHHLLIDGYFGPATESAVRSFQLAKRMSVDGRVSPVTYDQLVQPMRDAMRPIAANGRTLGELIVLHARQHLAEHPREIGGKNRGPWVRLYMDGSDGADQLWCAGFVSSLIRAACRDSQCSMPIRLSHSCDELARNARQSGRFLSERAVRADRTRVAPGSLFLVRSAPSDWSHVGVVTKLEPEFMHTIEGNTNDAGDREGYEVCARTRDYKAKDFIVPG